MKRKLKYHLRLFLTGALCIWSVILLFAWFVYRQEKHRREEIITERVRLTVGSVVDAHEMGRPVQPYLDFIKRYIKGTFLQDLSIQVYDIDTGQLLYSIGDLKHGIPVIANETSRTTLFDGSKVIRLIDTELGPEHEKLFFFSSRITPDGRMDIRSFMPYTDAINKAISIDPALWIMMITVGIIGSVLVYITTAHQAKNVGLLHEFAKRAASDRDFIPMGDFPSDEIGDISRQIVAIYNARMQAIVRREREHTIALQATEDKNHIKRVLTDNISHELKTPIGIIRAYLDMILTQDDMPEADKKRFLQKAQANVERIVSMLNDLSTMTRLEESTENIPMKEVDLHTLIFNIADEINTSKLIGNMEFEYKIPSECIVLGNEGLINSAIQNLIKNSFAYSQGTKIGIELIGKTDGYYTFSFYDNGVGVKEDHLAHLFDRFYRVDTGRSRKAGGTGLGLSIVKSSINNMGGSISVRIRKGGGLEFIFTLPRLKNKNENTALLL